VPDEIEIYGNRNEAKLLKNKRAKYQYLDQSMKEDMLTKKMNYRQTMGEKYKERYLENRRAKYQDLDQSMKDDLLTKNRNYKQTKRETFRKQESKISRFRPIKKRGLAY
jgi:hypothetical protein